MSDSAVSNPKGSGVADAGANADSLVRQRTVPTSNDQSCSQAHNGVLASDEKQSCEQGGRQQCSLHLWSKKALLNRKDIPKHLQFNPYIETGYRPLLSVWGCLMSLFYFHNETINIITHGKIITEWFCVVRGRPGEVRSVIRAALLAAVLRDTASSALNK